jgi:hypothetical protein
MSGKGDGPRPFSWMKCSFVPSTVTTNCSN